MAKLQDGRLRADVSADKTLALADQGLVQNVIADGKVVTLPATSAGAVFVIRNGGAAKTSGPVGSGDNGSVLVAVSPAAADKIQGLGFTAADNKDALNTKATAEVGDEIVLVGDGVDGWNVQRATGIWAREA